MSDPMVLDTDAQLDMSLDALIAAKTKGQKNRTQSVGYSASGAGKVRSTARVDRRLHSMPYARENPMKPMGLSMRRVYVGNLAWGVTWKELKDHMKQAGWVVKADVAIDSSGRSKVRYSEASRPCHFQVQLMLQLEIIEHKSTLLTMHGRIPPRIVPAGYSGF